MEEHSEAGVHTKLPEGEAETQGLLRLVAHKRDHDAYAQLFERYQTPAFNLALRILGSRAMAEEAVQEAMLQVWRSAGTFHWEGSVKSWIFRIVAHQSLHMARSRKREHKRVEVWAGGQRETEHTMTTSQPEREEESAVLRRLLDELPHAERQLLALHHGAGLTHEEIGASLSMPRRTVSKKIQKALESLRAGLVRAGLAAAAPVLGADRLVEAICAGETAPVGMREKTMSRLGEQGLNLSARFLAPPPAALGLSHVALVSLFALLCAAGGTLWWTTLQVTPPTLSTPPAPSAATPLPSEPSTSVQPQPQPQPQTLKDGWQPYPVAPLLRIAIDKTKLGSFKGMTHYASKEDKQAEWLAGTTPQNSWIEQVKPSLQNVGCAVLGPPQEGGIEVQGLIDYAGGDPDGWVMFLVSRSDVEGFDLLAKHRPEDRASPFRILFWLTPDGVRVITVRESPRAGTGVHTVARAPRDGKFCLGFGTSTRTAFRNLRMRKLPREWSPSHEPELQPFLPLIQKALDSKTSR